MKRASVGFVICVLGVGLVAPASSRAQSPAATVARIYSPLTPSGASRLPTVLRRGSCFTGSLAAARRDAWRCTVGSLIYDPCFKSARSRDLICVFAPWYRTAIRLRLTTALPRFGNRSIPTLQALPWALELADGRRCRFLTGATAAVGTKRLNYGCKTGSAALWGYPIRSRQPWAIFQAPGDARVLSELVAIRYAWM